MTSFYVRSLFGAGSLAVLAALFATGALGTWQLRRADEKAAQQRSRDAAAAAPARVLGAAPAAAAPRSSWPPAASPPAPLPPPGELDGQRVIAVGRFDASRSVFLDNRTRDGVAGFHLLTPLMLAGSDRSLLVLRGFVARDPADRARLPSPPTPDGEVRIEGFAQIRLDQPLLLGADQPPAPGERLWQHFEFDRYARWSGLSLYPVIVRQTVEPAWHDGLARDWAQPGMTVERHRAYAAQWLTMTAALAAVWVVLVRRGAQALARAGREPG
ncbi:MAG: SURF1 family protein [Lautropia sp.]